MSILIHRQGVAQSTLSGGATHTRTPLTAAQDIPAGFPVPIHTDMFDNGTHNKDIYSNIQADGGDLRVFSDEAMTTALPLELVEIDTGGGTEKLIAYFRTTDAVTNGSVIAYLRTTIAGGQSQPAVTDPAGRNAVWADYYMALHDVLTDSSGNLTPSATGTVALSGASILNGYAARGFGLAEGVDDLDRIDTGFVQSLGPHTISFLQFKATGNIAGEAWWRHNDWRLGYTTGQNWLRMRQAFDGTNAQFRAAGGNATDAWEHYAYSYDNSLAANAPVYIKNGVSSSTVADVTPSGSLVPNTDELFIGNDATSSKALQSRLGQFRVYNGVRDAAWMTAEYNGFFNPTQIATAGALVSV